MSSLTVDRVDALSPFGDRDLIPLPEIGNYLGMPRATRNALVSKGLVRTTVAPGETRSARGRKVLVTRDEALLIIAAALMAAALGIALVTAIRGLRNSGAVLTADALTIPLSGLSSLGKP